MVVMGGIHPTVLPDEALEHADAVVVEKRKVSGHDLYRMPPRARCKKYIVPEN